MFPLYEKKKNRAYKQEKKGQDHIAIDPGEIHLEILGCKYEAQVCGR